MKKIKPHIIISKFYSFTSKLCVLTEKTETGHYWEYLLEDAGKPPFEGYEYAKWVWLDKTNWIEPTKKQRKKGLKLWERLRGELILRKL